MKKTLLKIIFTFAIMFSFSPTTIMAVDNKNTNNPDETVETDKNKDNSSNEEENNKNEEQEIEELPIDGTITFETGIDKRYELPLSVKANKPVFYINNNINPGDILKSTIKFSNPTSEPLQFNISDIINLLPNDKISTELLDYLDFEITIDDSPIYKGLASKITNPLMGWVEIKPNESLDVEISYLFHKEADNTFQNANLKLKYEISVRGDVPEDPEEEEWFEYENPDIPEAIDTAVNFVKDNYIPFILIGIGGVILIIYFVKKKKDKDNNNNNQK